MTQDISTWSKAKDMALIGFVALASIGITKLLVDVSELKVTLAIYSTSLSDLRRDHDRLRGDVDQHFKEDRERFSRGDRR